MYTNLRYFDDSGLDPSWFIVAKRQPSDSQLKRTVAKVQPSAKKNEVTRI